MVTIEKYSDRSIVVRGEKTREYKDQLKELGGKWNPNLKGGAGWIFSLKKESKVRALLGKESASSSSASSSSEDIPLKTLIKKREPSSSSSSSEDIPLKTLIKKKEPSSSASSSSEDIPLRTLIKKKEPSSPNLTIEKYSDRSIVVRGEKTKEYKDQLKELGGKWNPNLKGGAGWIFSLKKESKVRALLGKESSSDSSASSSSEDIPLKTLIKKESSSSSDDEKESSSGSAEEKKMPHVKLLGECNEYSQKVNVPKTVKAIENFCTLLQANKVKDSKEAFLKLPHVVQCLFLQHAWTIISNKSKHSDNSYRTAFYLFKLFRSPEFKARPIYARYAKLGSMEKLYTKALHWNRETKEEPTKSRTTSTKSRTTSTKSRTTSTKSRAKSGTTKKYDKEYQRYATPEGETNPLNIFYTSLYKEKPSSPLAITWLTEYGLFDGEERQKLIKQYKKLLDSGKLIKLRG
uniref:Uncharacterized protein n=1 Tax=viral metagenome TaxID=1070528 RepID=A0A6C0EMS6_9ZZZZ